MSEHRGKSGNKTQHRNEEYTPPIDCSPIQFNKPLDPELFNGHAQKYAILIARSNRNANKSTQLRRFYEELVLWDNRCRQQPEKFEEFLPFIRMINAKTAYAKGRGLVTNEFLDLMQHSLKQVDTPEKLNHCKLFWEAFMGFYKQERQD